MAANESTGMTGGPPTLLDVQGSVLWTSWLATVTTSAMKARAATALPAQMMVRLVFISESVFADARQRNTILKAACP